MFTTIFLVALTSTIFEVAIAHKWTWYRRMASGSILVNLAGSMALSALVGWAYGMVGLIAGVAAMLSTLMTIPYYKCMLWWDKEGERLTESFHRTKENWLGLWRDLVRMVEITIRIITAPLRAYRWCARIIRNTRSSLHWRTS